MADVTMPRLSDTMEEGTIASWLKKPGEKVDRGEVIAQIETDKATMDLTAFEAGTLQEILAPEGSTVAIGQPVARIGSGNGSPMARHIAAEHDLDLSHIQGSGPQGRIIRADVEAALATPPTSAAAPAPQP